jgi:hypothetical protein
MKGKLIFLLILVGFSFFCGFIVIAIGFGSIFPVINQVAAPIVCPNNTLKIVQDVTHYHPGETSWTATATCTDSATGKKKDVTFLLQVVAGLFYSLFPLGGISLFVSRLKKEKIPEENDDDEQDDAQVENRKKIKIENRLAKLKGLYDAGLISLEEYQKKKEKILEKL